jgi:hypothetical protein
MKRKELKEVIRQAMLKEVGTLSKVTGLTGKSICTGFVPCRQTNFKKQEQK